MALVALLLLSFLCAWLLCWAYRRLAIKMQFVDTPNARSSHHEPTPNGGGVAIIFALVLALVVAGVVSLVPGSTGSWDGAYWLMLIAALVLSVLGVLDDALGLSIRLRLMIYSAVCLVTVWMLMGIFPLGDVATSSAAAHEGIAIACSVVIAFAMLWLLNLYNFMDGIDGIAALETISVCSVVAALVYGSSGDSQYALFCLLLATVHAGFLVLNWQPAKLFMGDAGSVATGFLMGALIVYGALSDAISPACWAILLGVFVVDASWTLVWRMLTRQPFTQPHRSHAYQRLSRHFGSHSKVDFVVLAINLVWLTPLALAVVAWPQHALILVILAYVPLLTGMAKIRRFT